MELLASSFRALGLGHHVSLSYCPFDRHFAIVRGVVLGRQPLQQVLPPALHIALPFKRVLKSRSARAISSVLVLRTRTSDLLFQLVRWGAFPVNATPSEPMSRSAPGPSTVAGINV